MNLAIVTPELCAHGGSEIYLLECLRRWQQVLQITLYTPAHRPALLEEFGIDRRRVVVRRLVSVGAAIGSAPGGSDARECLWDRQIATHDLYFLYRIPAGRIRRRPSVWFAGESFRLALRPPRRTLPFDRLATHSRATGRWLERVCGRAPDLIAPAGIEVRGDFEPPRSLDRFVYVGRRSDLVLDALARIPRWIHMTVAGDASDGVRLARLARERGMADRVAFVGDVTMEERRRLHRESACCVYAPRGKPLGLAPLEAAAAGRPVVATRGGGCEEILNGEAACLVPADAMALAGAIDRVLSDPERVTRMGRAARQLVEPLTWDRTAEQLLTLFCRAARRARQVSI